MSHKYNIFIGTNMDENNIDPELLRQFNEALQSLGNVSSNLSDNLTKNVSASETVTKAFTSLGSEISKLQALTKNYQAASEKTIKASQASNETYATAVSNLDTSFTSLTNSAFKLQGAFDGLTSTINNLNGSFSNFGPPRPPGSDDEDGGFGGQNPIVRALYNLLGSGSQHLGYLDNIYGTIGSDITSILGILEAWNKQFSDMLAGVKQPEKIQTEKPVEPKNINTDSIQDIEKLKQEEIKKLREAIAKEYDYRILANGEAFNIAEEIKKIREEFEKQKESLFASQEANKSLEDKQNEIFDAKRKELKKQLDQMIGLTQVQYAGLKQLNKQIEERQQEILKASDPEKYQQQIMDRYKDLKNILPDYVKYLREQSLGIKHQTSLGKFAAETVQLFATGLQKALPIITNLFEVASIAIKGLITSVVSYTRALLNGERGQEAAAKAVSKFTTALGEGLKELGSGLQVAGVGLALLTRGNPLGLLASAVTMLLGTLLKFAPNVTELFNELNETAGRINDNLYKSFSDLANIGAAGGRGMTEVFETAQKLQLQVAELPKFIDLIRSAGKDMKMLGITANEGMKRFANTAGGLLESQLGRTLEKMGITADDQRAHTLEFMAREARLNNLQGKSQQELIAGAGKYIKELDMLATLTGASRKDAEDARKRIMGIEELRAKLMTVEDEQERKRLSQQIKFAEALDMAGFKDLAAGVAKFQAAGAVTENFSEAARRILEKEMDFISQGGNVQEALIRSFISVSDNAKQYAEAGKFNAEGLRQLTGESFATIADGNARYKDLIKKYQETGTFDAEEFLRIQRAPSDRKTQEYVDTFVRGTRELAITFERRVNQFGDATNVSKLAADKFYEGVKKFDQLLEQYLGPKPSGPTPIELPSAVSPEFDTGDRSDQVALDELRVEREKAKEEEKNRFDKWEQNQKILDSLSKKNLELKEKEQQALQILEEAKKNNSHFELARANSLLKLIKVQTAENQKRMQEAEATQMAMQAESKTRTQSSAYAGGGRGTTAGPSATDYNRAQQQAASTKDPLEGLNFGGKREERTGGGKVDPKLIELARKIHETYPGSIFTAMNDLYHQENSRFSKHTKGKALDFVLSKELEPKNADEANDIWNQLMNLGAASVRDEYFKDVNSRTTGKHFHVEIAHNGGFFRAPSGKEFPVLLKSNELVLTETMVKNIQSQLSQVQKDSVGSVLPEALKTSGPANPDVLVEKVAKAVIEGANAPLSGTLLDNTSNLSDRLLQYMSRQEEIIESLNSAVANMVNILEESRDIQDDLLTHSRI